MCVRDAGRVILLPALLIILVATEIVSGNARGYAPMKINLPKKAVLAEQVTDLRTNGIIFPLDYTSVARAAEDNDGSFDPSEAYSIRMRYVSTMDKAVIEAMPAEAQKQVWDGLKSLQKAQAKHKDPESLLQVAANNEEQVRAADYLFCAAAIEPRVVLTEEEARLGGEDVYWVGTFLAEDRLSFFAGTIGGNSEISRKFKLFRPEQGTPVQGGTVHRLDRSEIVGDAGHPDGLS